MSRNRKELDEEVAAATVAGEDVSAVEETTAGDDMVNAMVDEEDFEDGGNEGDEVDDEIVIHSADAEDLAERMAVLQREQRGRAESSSSEGAD
ncbi:MAG: hypothetical protein QOF61_2272, partial [Acidobacteriota bacterium]|nr:hypothetical protein [Acidobacteriota bacterium]